VITAANANGSATIQMYLNWPFFAMIAMHTARAIAARSWFAIPNSGNRVLIPPSGSVTPIISTAPQRSTMIPVVSHAPARQEVFLNFGKKLPRLSCSMKRATRVPASTAVRMKSASNMIAKWYQKAIMPEPPATCCMMWASPTESVGAPPVRETIVASPTSFAVWVSISGVRFTPVRPRLFTNVTAPSTVPPVSAPEEFIAK
jgi:hypothetical protein